MRNAKNKIVVVMLWRRNTRWNYTAATTDALDLSGAGGITHALAAAAWNQNIAQFETDFSGVSEALLYASVLAGYITLGDADSFALAQAAAGELAGNDPRAMDPADYNLTLAPYLSGAFRGQTTKLGGISAVFQGHGISGISGTDCSIE